MRESQPADCRVRSHLLSYSESAVAGAVRNPSLDLGPWAQFTLGSDVRVLRTGVALFAQFTAPEWGAIDGLTVPLARIGDATGILAPHIHPNILEQIQKALSQLQNSLRRSASAPIPDCALDRLAYFFDAVADSLPGAAWYRLGRALGEWLAADFFAGPNETIPFGPVVEMVSSIPIQQRPSIACLNDLAKLVDAGGLDNEAQLRQSLVTGPLADCWSGDASDPRFVVLHFWTLPWKLLSRIDNDLLQLKKQIAEFQSQQPKWVKDTGKLLFGDIVIKQIVVGKATNVVTVLDEFEEKNWPSRINYPPECMEETLHYTIRSLNERLDIIRFRSDGQGKGIVWELATLRSDRS